MNNPTERRLALLEQQLRQTRRFNRLLVGALLLLAFMGFRKNEELQHLQVKSLSVVNEGGKVVAKLDANASSGWLQLMDSSGTLHAQAGAGTNGGYLNLFNKKKQHTVWLTQMTEGGGYVGVKNPSGKEVAWLGVKQDESGYAGTADWSGNTRVTMGSHNGSGFTEWYNRNGYGTVKLYANDNSMAVARLVFTRISEMCVITWVSTITATALRGCTTDPTQTPSACWAVPVWFLKTTRAKTGPGWVWPKTTEALSTCTTATTAAISTWVPGMA